MARPALSTDRLTLVPLRDDAEHTELLVGLDADPEVMRYLTGRPSTREDVIAAHGARTDPALDRAGLGYWLGFTDDDFVGWWGMVPPGRWGDAATEDTGPGQAELGYRLMRAHWGQGHATEASRAMLAHAFGPLALRRVFATTMAVNAGSRRVMERIGMEHVRTFHPAFDEPLAGTEHGEVEYATTRERWRPPTCG